MGTSEMLKVAAALFFVLWVLPASGHAAVVTIEGTIKSVDAKKRTITVETGKKSKSFDVSSKVKIHIEGKDAALDSLKTGQKVRLSYHDELEIVLSIDVARPDQSAKDKIAGISLFSGIDLDGWSVLTHGATKKKDSKSWVADPERKVLCSLGGDFNELRTNGRYKDFTLTMEWRFTPGGFISGNGSGIIVRSNGLNTIALDPRGIEIDILNDKDIANNYGTGCFVAYSMPVKNHKGETKGEVGKGYSSRRLGWLKEPKLRPGGEWNKMEVTCERDRIRVTINGELINEGWGVPEEAGHICLRNQNTSIEFRNVQVVSLSPKKEK